MIILLLMAQVRETIFMYVILARAHLLSLDYLFENQSLFSIFNLGTGKSHSVLEVIKNF